MGSVVAETNRIAVSLACISNWKDLAEGEDMWAGETSRQIMSELRMTHTNWLR